MTISNKQFILQLQQQSFPIIHIHCCQVMQIRHHQGNEHFTRHDLAIFHRNIRFPIFIRFFQRPLPLRLTSLLFPHILRCKLFQHRERQQRFHRLHKRFSVFLQIPTRPSALHLQLASNRSIREHIDRSARVFIANRSDKAAGRHEVHFRLRFRLRPIEWRSLL